jgi:hypothetical protein
MIKIIKKKKTVPKKKTKAAPTETPPINTPNTPGSLALPLPIIGGIQAIEILRERRHGTVALYRLEDGTTVWAPRKVEI